MSIETADILFPVNTTTVDTGAGVDVRRLSDTAGANDVTQTATATHTQDNVERTLDPATAGVTNTNNAGTTMFKMGWALRLSEDMTPDDDTNCNAVLTDGTINVLLDVTINQSGGTYASGSYGPTWRASLWRYNPSTDTGTLIAVGSVATPTWTIGGVGVDLGTFKTATVSINVPANVEFQPGEILLLQVGLNTGTIPNPTLGTGTWTYTLRLGSVTKVDFVAGQGVRQVCYTEGASVGAGAGSGVPVVVLPSIGAVAVVAAASGAVQAEANMAGSSTGIGSASGATTATAHMAGLCAGIGVAGGALVATAHMAGLSAGVAAAMGVAGAAANMTGLSGGVGAAGGTLGARAFMSGASAGVAVASGGMASRSDTTGTAVGVGLASGVPAVIVPTTGVVDIAGGGGGGTTIVRRIIRKTTDD